MEATTHIGAEPGEHTENRTTWRNGYREKPVTMQAGDLDLAIPKVRVGSFFPVLLERRRRIEHALYAVLMESYVLGVSSRSVDDLVKALGSDTGVSKSEVSHICAEFDGQLTAFRERRLDHICFPYVYFDATYVHARVSHQIVSLAVVIATGVTEEGGREVLGVMVGDGETRGVLGRVHALPTRPRAVRVKLVISDAHTGLIAAIRKVMLGAALQRCRVHFVLNVFGGIAKAAAEMVAATIRTIFAQPDATAVRAQLDAVAVMLGAQFPKVEHMLIDAKAELTAFAGFPHGHWKKIQSPNPLERLNREVKRRSDVVQVFSNTDAVLYLVIAVLFELHDEWTAFPHRYLPEGTMEAIYGKGEAQAQLPAPSQDPHTAATPLQGT